MGLDNYDDQLPDGIPSWKDFVGRTSDLKETLLAENITAVAAAVEQLKTDTEAELKSLCDAAIRETCEKFRVDLNDNKCDWLDDEASAEFIASCTQMANDYELTRV